MYTILNDLDRLEEIIETVEIDPVPDHFNSLGHITLNKDLKSLVALVELSRNCDPTIPVTYIEVGSWAGRSALAVASRPNVEVHCVDHWNGSPGPEGASHREKIAKCEDPENVFGVFKKNTEGYNIIPHRGDSLEWARKGIGKQADVVFIDGDHRYENALADMKSWVSHVCLGGIFCGHDYNFAGVYKAAKEFGFDASVWGVVWYKRTKE